MSRALTWMTYLLIAIGGFAVATAMMMDLLYSVDLRGRPSERFMVMAGLGLPILLIGVVGWSIIAPPYEDSNDNQEQD